MVLALNQFNHEHINKIYHVVPQEHGDTFLTLSVVSLEQFRKSELKVLHISTILALPPNRRCNQRISTIKKKKKKVKTK